MDLEARHKKGLNLHLVMAGYEGICVADTFSADRDDDFESRAFA